MATDEENRASNGEGLLSS